MKIPKISYHEAKRRAKDLYNHIGSVASPVFDGRVIFNRIGFNHLIRKGRTLRPRSEQIRRFALLRYAGPMIENPAASVLYREERVATVVNRYGRRTRRVSTIHYWMFKEEIEDCNIKVVVSQTEKGTKHFLSIMGDNIEII